jgi:hypothetical protein
VGREPVVYRTMTYAEQQLAMRLSRCSFPIGSFAKRFARDLGHVVRHPCGVEPKVTDKQFRMLLKLVRRYRRQIRPDSVEEEHRFLLEEPPEPKPFWLYVLKGERCWEWIGATNEKGYGVARIDGRNVRANRFSWELHHGPIADGLLVCHQCDNPICVRPDHLFLGTNDENMADMVAKGRARGASPGETNHAAKLTALQVQQIKARLGTVSNRRLAREFGVSPWTINSIATGKVWASVPSAQLPLPEVVGG